MKLKCEDHDRRVMVLDKSTVHRNDGSQCKAHFLYIGDTTTTPGNVREYYDASTFMPWHLKLPG